MPRTGVDFAVMEKKEQARELQCQEMMEFGNGESGPLKFELLPLIVKASPGVRISLAPPGS